MIFIQICLIFPKVSYGIDDEIMWWIFFLIDILLEERKKYGNILKVLPIIFVVECSTILYLSQNFLLGPLPYIYIYMGKL
jgi:hypothetical protein